MMFTDEYTAQREMEIRTRMIAKEVARSGWVRPVLPAQMRVSRLTARLSWQACRLLAALGNRLVVMGRRLERYSRSQPSLQRG